MEVEKKLQGLKELRDYIDGKFSEIEVLTQGELTWEKCFNSKGYYLDTY